MVPADANKADSYWWSALCCSWRSAICRLARRLLHTLLCLLLIDMIDPMREGHSSSHIEPMQANAPA